MNNVVKVINEEYYNTLIEMYQAVARHVTVQYAIEIGTGWGNSAQAFLNFFPHAKLVSVDQENYHHVFEPLSQAYGPRIKIVKGKTPYIYVKENLCFLADFIYIDAAHDYESVKCDILGVSQLLCKGGVIAFDDYGLEGETEEHLPHGVKDAVDELVPNEWDVVFEKRHIKAFRKE